MQATTHRLSTMRRVGKRAWNLAIHLRAKAVNHKLINNAVWSPHFAQRPAVSSQSTQRWTQLSTKLSSLSLMTNLYNNASSAKSCNSLTQASYHRDRVVDVSVNTRRTLTTYPHPGLTAAQDNDPSQEPPLLAQKEEPLRSHHCCESELLDYIPTAF